MDTRSQLVDKITARLEGITKANGFQSDIGLKVFCWRKTPMDANSVPGIVFKDEDASINLGTRDEEDVPLKKWQHRLKVTVEVYFKGGVAASEARKSLADLVKAAFPDPDKVGRWDGLAQKTFLLGHAINVEQTGDVIAGAQVIFLIHYLTPQGTL